MSTDLLFRAGFKMSEKAYFLHSLGLVEEKDMSIFKNHPIIQNTYIYQLFN